MYTFAFGLCRFSLKNIQQLKKYNKKYCREFLYEVEKDHYMIVLWKDQLDDKKTPNQITTVYFKSCQPK